VWTRQIRNAKWFGASRNDASRQSSPNGTVNSHKEHCHALHAPCLRGYADWSTFFMSVIREVSWEVEQRSGVRPEVIEVVRHLYMTPLKLRRT
jgi:hypothetical protein